MLSTYRMADTLDFFAYLLEQERDEQLWEIWLHKPTKHENDFQKFKQASIEKHKQKTNIMTKEQEEAAIAKAERILKGGGG